MTTSYRDLPPITREQIAAGLRGLGLRAGDTVLVHSAMSRLGHVQGGAAAVVAAFLDVLGESGTLAVPTFPFNGSMLAYVRSDPDFDVDLTPSRMGRISEQVRTAPGAQRSLEPAQGRAHDRSDVGVRDDRQGMKPIDTWTLRCYTW